MSARSLPNRRAA